MAARRSGEKNLLLKVVRTAVMAVGVGTLFSAPIRIWNTLSPYLRKRVWKARNGEQGGSRHKTGKSGEDLICEVPCGTLIYQDESDDLIADLTEHDQEIVVVSGGNGGRGNLNFKTATNQTPRKFTIGKPGVELTLRLSLKLIADIGIIGYPNAGKSTLLSRLSGARPKIGNYPFTTLSPQLGVIERPDRCVVLADIPGLIEGAAEGIGLGHQFLRHVERCGLLVHLIDGSQGEIDDLRQHMATLNHELARFSPELANKEQLVVLNKVDARPDLAEIATTLAAELEQDHIPVISGVSGEGLRELENILLQWLVNADAE